MEGIGRGGAGIERGGSGRNGKRGSGKDSKAYVMFTTQWGERSKPLRVVMMLASCRKGLGAQPPLGSKGGTAVGVRKFLAKFEHFETFSRNLKTKLT